jgi:HEAT repeat protein
LGLLFFAFSLLPVATLAQRSFRDPVEDLRKALLSRSDPSIKKAAAKLKNSGSIGDLRRALLLPALRGTEGSSKEDKEDIAPRLPAVNAAQEKIAQELAKRLKKALKADSLTRRAAADLIGEIGTTIPPPGENPRETFTFQLAPQLVDLLESTKEDLRVRQAAARSLGRIRAGPREEWVWDPKDKKVKLQILRGSALPALDAALQKGPPGLRRAAANGLYAMVRDILRGGKERAYTGIEALAICRDIIPSVARGLQDSDPGVRRWCVKTIRQTAVALGALPKLYDDNEIRKVVKKALGKDEDDLDKRGELTREARREASERGAQLRLDVAEALAEAGPALANLLNDRNRRVSLEVRRALVEISLTRYNMLHPSEDSKPAPRKDKETPRRMTGAGQSIFDVDDLQAADFRSDGNRLLQVAQRDREGVEDELFKAVQPSVNRLARGLTDPQPRARLESLHFLELLGEAAEKAADAIIKAMCDPNPFVRWAAARTIGKLRRSGKVPPKPEKAVPALAALLKDSDIDVRLAAAATLELYGPKAAGAVDALIYCLKVGDPSIRLAAMRTLLSIGDPALRAIPALIALLSDSEAKLRQGAAETLGRFGRSARQAVPALRKLLDDSDADVRKAASEALLNIEGS